MTCLQLACSEGHLSVVQFLVEHGQIEPERFRSLGLVNTGSVAGNPATRGFQARGILRQSSEPLPARSGQGARVDLPRITVNDSTG